MSTDNNNTTTTTKSDDDAIFAKGKKRTRTEKKEKEPVSRLGKGERVYKKSKTGADAEEEEASDGDDHDGGGLSALERFSRLPVGEQELLMLRYESRHPAGASKGDHEEGEEERSSDDAKFFANLRVFLEDVERRTNQKLLLHCRHPESTRFMDVGVSPGKCFFKVDRRTGILIHHDAKSPRGKITDEGAWRVVGSSGFLRYYSEMASLDPLWKKHVAGWRKELDAATAKDGRNRTTTIKR